MTQLGKNAALMGGMAAVAAAVGLYAWYGVKAPAEKEEAQKAAEAKLITFGPGEATDGGSAGVELERVVVEAKGDLTTLEKADGKWRIVSPVKAAADEVTVDGLVSKLTAGKVKDVVEERPTKEDLARYGLDTPRFTVTATAKDSATGQTKEIVLRGGGENTFDGSVYLQRGEDPKVYSAQGGLRWSLEKSTFDLRDKQVLSVKEEALTRVEVKGPGVEHPFTLERDKENDWKLVHPKQAKADGDAVKTFLSSLGNHRASSFPADSPKARKDLGLEAPAITATFTRKEGAPITLALASAEDKVTALRTEGEVAVLALVPQAALDAFKKDPASLEDKAILSFENDDVAKIAFRTRQDQIVVERDLSGEKPSQDWKVVSPREGPAQKWKLSSLLWMLGALEAKEVVAEAPKAWTKWGLDDPERTVELFGKDGKVLASLKLGREVEGEENLRYARGAKDQVVTVSTDRLKDLPVKVEDLLDVAAEEEKATASAEKKD